MPAVKMHDDEVPTDVTLVRRLLAAQFPQWADLSIAPVPSAGTDNALFRMGDTMAVRLPRIHWATGQVEKEQQWLPRLAPHLPLAIPVPLAMGIPGEGYPFHWSVCQWLEGENATLDRITDPCQMAADLAQFILALQQIDTTDGPLAGPDNFSRGVPLAMRDAEARAALIACRGLLDTERATAIWEDALNTPVWDRPPVWLHGDLQSGNLLAVNGRLTAVIDFGGLGVGDPASDLLIAWNLFSGESRQVFRTALNVDEATWIRGRGLALCLGLLAIPYYRETNPALAGMYQRTIAEIFADYVG